MAKLVVDPGHGGRDPGAQQSGFKEKDIVLAYSLLLVTQLSKRGHVVNLTRSTDVDLAPEITDWRKGKREDMQRRCDLSNSLKADAFISIHANAGPFTSSNGAWVL